MIERRSGRLLWWLRPGGTILAALPFLIALLVAMVIGVLLPISNGYRNDLPARQAEAVA